MVITHALDACDSPCMHSLFHTRKYSNVNENILMCGSQLHINLDGPAQFLSGSLLLI